MKQSWGFRNKINKPQARMIKEKKNDRTQITGIRNKRNITTDRGY